MPNAFANLVFFAWPFVVIGLFKALPLRAALVWSMVLGYIFLPSLMQIDLPVLPTIGRAEMLSLAAAGVAFYTYRASHKGSQWTSEPIPAVPIKPAPTRRSRARMLVLVLLVILVSQPVATVLTNSDPVIAGPTFLPGLRVYDALSVIVAMMMTLLPFVVAVRFLGTDESQVLILRVLCLSMVGYAFLALYEVRMSPQLNNKIYGFFSSSFLQHIRAGGYRPMVFFKHGLELGIFLAMSVLATAGLWRHTKRNAGLSAIWLICVAWLLFTLVLAKSVGPLVITLALLPFVLFSARRLQLLLAATLAMVVLLYPMLRGAGYIPTEAIYEYSLSKSPERAESLKYRLDNEDALLDRANERPLLGWGGWSRNRVFDPYTGHDLSVTDGMWIIVIGVSGWIGYIAQFGLLTVPIILLSLNRRRLKLSIATSSLTLVLSANLVDLLPNAALTPITWLLAGALMGRYIDASEDLRRPAAEEESPDDAPAPNIVQELKIRQKRTNRDAPTSKNPTVDPVTATHKRQPRRKSG